jgi:hypothetical protein
MKQSVTQLPWDAAGPHKFCLCNKHTSETFNVQGGGATDDAEQRSCTLSLGAQLSIVHIYDTFNQDYSSVRAVEQAHGD